MLVLHVNRIPERTMELFTFIPADRTKADESVQVAANSLSNAIALLWPEGPADANHQFIKSEWSVFAITMREVL